jgi:hypothetical protein
MMRTFSLDRCDVTGRTFADRLADTAPSVEAQALAGIRDVVLTECIAKLKPRSQAVIGILHGLGRERGGLPTVAAELGTSYGEAIEERDYAHYQLDHLVKLHRRGALLIAA